MTIMLNHQNLLVSVIVITYNSSKYVLETLESIKRQTYSNLEVIISDDCSADNTVEICREFLDENQNIRYFKEAKIVSTSKNSGITPNYNNGLKYATGEWIKYIAGDDILIENCIEEYVRFVLKENDLYIAVCGMDFFYTETPSIIFAKEKVKLLEGDATKQLRAMIKDKALICGATLFIERKTLVQLEGFDEKYLMVEDWPLCMKYLIKDFRIGIIHKELIRKRNHYSNVSLFDSRFSPSVGLAVKDLAIPQAKKQKMYFYWYYLFVDLWIIKYSHVNFFYKTIGYLMRSIDIINYEKKINRLYRKLR